MSMYTDPTRLRATDPGHVEGNPVFTYHDAFNPNKEEVEEMKRLYRIGGIGDVAVKRALVKALNDFLDPIRQERAKYEESPRWCARSSWKAPAKPAGAGEETIAHGARGDEDRLLPRHRHRTLASPQSRRRPSRWGFGSKEAHSALPPASPSQ